MRSLKSTSVIVTFAYFCIFSGTAKGAGELLGQTTWTAGNNHTYALVLLRGATWGEAQDDLALTLPGYHLATITSQAENDFVWEFVQEKAFGSQWWLGGFQDVGEETDPAEGWMWVTGEAWIYTNWGSGEPNNAGGIEDHLALDRGFWNDEGTAISSVSGYVAEVVPVPPAVWLLSSALGVLGWLKRRSA